MEKKIPIYFDNAVIVSPLEPISNTNGIGRLKVGVFTRYGNRNGSYIKDNVAEMLIESATRGDTPVVGFFDPESKSWAGHTGPTLANAYGYVEGFEGWQLFTDSDNVQREYAVFSVVFLPAVQVFRHTAHIPAAFSPPFSKPKTHLLRCRKDSAGQGLHSYLPIPLPFSFLLPLFSL